MNIQNPDSKTAFISNLLTSKTPIRFNVPKARRTEAVLGSHRLEITLPDGNTVLIGRGSYGAINTICYYANPKSDTPLLEVGEFCEISDAKILLGGEHRNDQALNITFAAMPILASLATANKLDAYTATTKGSIKIGDLTIVSHNAVILSGAIVGKGCVIGAGSVVRGEIPPLTIWVGNPGRMLPRQLDTAERLWLESLELTTLDWETLGGIFANYPIHRDAVLSKNVTDYPKQNPEDTTNAILFDSIRNPHGRLELRNLMGVRYKEHVIRAAMLPAFVVAYLRQALGEDGPMDWTPCLFDWAKSDLDKCLPS